MKEVSSLPARRLLISKKSNTPMSGSGMDSPDDVFEPLAQCPLPKLQEYYESDEGKKALIEWEDKHMQDK